MQSEVYKIIDNYLNKLKLEGGGSIFELGDVYSRYEKNQ